MTAIDIRTAEILAEWEAELDAREAEWEARVESHARWVDYMVNVERIRPETLPCVHGTEFWPDRGQVCGGCEADADDPTRGMTDEEIAESVEWARRENEARARAQAESELLPAGDTRPWGSDPLPPF